MTSRIRILLGKLVCKLRSRIDMTQERLAELLDISRRYVQRIEKGEANLGADILFGLPLALNVSWDELREAMPRTLSDWWRMKGKKKGQ